MKRWVLLASSVALCVSHAPLASPTGASPAGAGARWQPVTRAGERPRSRGSRERAAPDRRARGVFRVVVFMVVAPREVASGGLEGGSLASRVTPIRPKTPA